jgi:hypothetical protein
MPQTYRYGVKELKQTEEPREAERSPWDQEKRNRQKKPNTLNARIVKKNGKSC